MASSGIRMARNTRLEILRRAREILSDPTRWTKQTLRRFTDGEEQYCVAGALERAAYDLGYANETSQAFDNGDVDGNGPLGYLLSGEMSLSTFSEEKYEKPPWSVNDQRGYETTMELLDTYIVEVEEGRAREPEVE